MAVDLMDKSRGPGGRLASKRVDGGSVDVGAQYFTIRDARFQQFLHEYAGPDAFAPWAGTLLHEAEPGMPEPWQGSERYVGTPRMTAISRALSAHVSGTWETRADQVHGHPGDLWIRDTQGHDHGPFDRVVITAPPAQARDLVRADHTAVATLQDYEMHATWAVAVRFPEPLRLSFDAMGLKDPTLGWVARDASKPGRKAGEWWVLHATSDWSEAHRDDDSDTVIEALLAVFGERFGLEPVADQTLAHRWLYARPASSSQPGYLALESQGLAFCGDWLNGGRVEGAWQSARDLLEHWQNQLDPETGSLLS